MEASAAEGTASVVYVGWEEVAVSSDKGRREVHYYLNRSDGGSDLAVVGKEKSLRHMSYYYAIKNRTVLMSLAPPPKLKSRREVVDWLNSIVSDMPSHQSSQQTTSFDSSDYSGMDTETFKDSQWKKSQYKGDFSWLGCPWTCRKRRKHYKSFSRNGVKISVHNFVYVLAEKDKRLVAYLEDMYEDSKGNKMIVVRWFHKIDEVGIALPHNFNDREIFFSLCLQDLSIECIDGLAAVLSPQHFEKFLNEARHTKLEPFVCCKQFENDDVKPFDITRVNGYWKQEILRYMYTMCPAKDQAKSQRPHNSFKEEGDDRGADVIRPKKRLRRLKDSDTSGKESTEMAPPCMRNDWNNCKTVTEMGSLRGEGAMLSITEAKQNLRENLHVGSEVEVLSQDSGIRGCWFRASIIKKHKDKVKVRYQDIKDAADEANKLEEWILASKVAAPDQLGLRILGRGIIRPCLRDCVPLVVDVGTAVDAWWQDTWCEGVIVQKESEDRIHVYFPGEKQELGFSYNQLRPSLEWLGNGWRQIKGRPDIVTSIPSRLEKKKGMVKSDGNKLDQGANYNFEKAAKADAGCNESPQYSGVTYEGKQLGVVYDLSKDDLLSQLRWRTSKKRKRVSAGSGLKVPENRPNPCERFVIPTSLKADREKCKYMGDSLFTSTVVQPLASLVMSR